jgi:two-component system sensor histidine kinase KdpD
MQRVAAVMPRDPRKLVRALLLVPALLGATTVLVALLEDVVGVPNASSTYLLAVLVAAGAYGTPAAVVAAVGAFLLYDFLFIEPLYTFTVRDPGEWLNLILLLVVGIVVGQFAAAIRRRAESAVAREREARALFRVSRALATRSSTSAALDEIVAIARSETGMERVWIGLGGPGTAERVVADSGDAGSPPTPPASRSVLQRMPGDTPARWVKVHQPAGKGGGGGTGGGGTGGGGTGGGGATARTETGTSGHRVVIEAAGHTLGSLWATRPRSSGDPDIVATRLLASTADQVGQALEQDRLAAEARAAEVARQSDAVKSALLESVSHDLRTPLASIRAAAGTLLDPRVQLADDDRRATAEGIDREAEHLNRLVTNLLDLSRIEGGALKADIEPFELGDLVEAAVARVRPRAQARRLEIAVGDELPPVLVDAVYLDQILANLLENSMKYTADDGCIRVSAMPDGDDASRLRLTVDDDGPGVPDEALPLLFEKFYRVPRQGERSRPGTGIGLAVVRGLTEAMGGRVVARHGELGGLAVDVSLPTAAALAPRPD